LLLLLLAAAVLYTLLALDIDPVERLLQLLPMSEVRVAAALFLAVCGMRGMGYIPQALDI
jgi:multisubunit Na+/H+ antiporter MnhB subunit